VSGLFLFSSILYLDFCWYLWPLAAKSQIGSLETKMESIILPWRSAKRLCSEHERLKCTAVGTLRLRNFK
jgi:hypothetical protein